MITLYILLWPERRLIHMWQDIESNKPFELLDPGIRLYSDPAISLAHLMKHLQSKYQISISTTGALNFPIDQYDSISETILATIHGSP